MLTISWNNQRVEKVEYKLLGIAIDEYFEPYRYVRKILKGDYYTLKLLKTDNEKFIQVTYLIERRQSQRNF